MKEKEAKKLKKLYKGKEYALGLSHEVLSQKMDLDKSQVSHMLNGRNPINLHRGLQFCEILDIELQEFSSRLVREAQILTRMFGDKSRAGSEGEAVAQLVGVDMDIIRKVLKGESPAEKVNWPRKHSSATYALLVEGEANDPKLPHGAVAIVDAEVVPEVGDLVCYTGGAKLIFARSKGDGMVEFTNEDYPNRIFKITKKHTFVGVVIGHQVYSS